MKNFKFLLICCLVAALTALCLFALPTQVSAAEITASGTCGDNLTWTLDDEGTLTISGTGAMYEWAEWDTPWITYDDGIHSVVIENGVTTICDYAFISCDIRNVTIGNSVTTIGDYAFANNSYLNNLVIGSSVTDIGDSAFNSCIHLMDLTIPDSVVTIGKHAFGGIDEMRRVSIGKGVTTIDDFAFDGDHNLCHITYAGTQSQWNDISIGMRNTYLTDAPTFHYEAKVYYTKNCENSGLFCTGCYTFIEKYKSESGTHTYSNIADRTCDDCDYVRLVKSIEISQKPTALKYDLFCEDISVAGGKLKVTYSDDTDGGYVDMTPEMVSKFDNFALGTQTLTVTYEKKTDAYSIEVVPGVPDSLVLTTLPDKRDYFTGDSVDMEGLTLTAVYNGKGDVVLTSNYYTVDAVDMSTHGIKMVTLRVNGVSVDYKIFVHNKQSQKLDIDTYPESKHNYSANTDESKTFTYSGANLLVLTFNSSSYTETNSDFVYIYDKEGREVACFSGTISGKSVTVLGDTFTVRLTSDASTNKYGYAFSSIVAETIIHSEQPIPPTATCISPGMAGGTCCEVCGVVLIPQQESGAFGHSFTNYLSNNDATCLNDGTETAKCDRCDATHNQVDVGSKLGHSFTNYLSNNDATCLNDGTETAKCDRCNATHNQVDIGSKLGHSFTNYLSNNDATCLNDGTETAKCDRCNATHNQIDVGSKLGHSFTNYLSNNDATCLKDGTETAKCDRCEVTNTRTDVDSKLGHSFTNYVSNNDATCLEDGTETAKCDRCTETDTRTDVDSKLGHSFTNYVSNNDATCLEDGTETAKCDRCTETDTRTDADSELGHSFTNYVSNNDATYDADGTKTAKCDRCDATDTVTDTGSKLIRNGWVLDSGKWYYYKNDAQLTGWANVGGVYYYFNASGVMQTGWLKQGNVWYYLKSSGAMATGWAQAGGKWYYFASSGAMVTGWQKVGGVWYYFQSGGAMQTGWLKLGNTWYYFNASGAMATGSVKIGAKTYRFNASGVCLNP